MDHHLPGLRGVSASGYVCVYLYICKVQAHAESPGVDLHFQGPPERGGTRKPDGALRRPGFIHTCTLVHVIGGKADLCLFLPRPRRCHWSKYSMDNIVARHPRLAISTPCLPAVGVTGAWLSTSHTPDFGPLGTPEVAHPTACSFRRIHTYKYVLRTPPMMLRTSIRCCRFHSQNRTARMSLLLTRTCGAQLAVSSHQSSHQHDTCCRLSQSVLLE